MDAVKIVALTVVLGLCPTAVHSQCYTPPPVYCQPVYCSPPVTYYTPSYYCYQPYQPTYRTPPVIYGSATRTIRVTEDRDYDWRPAVGERVSPRAAVRELPPPATEEEYEYPARRIPKRLDDDDDYYQRPTRPAPKKAPSKDASDPYMKRPSEIPDDARSYRRPNYERRY